ncbi:MAG: hypothetical protein ACREDS_05950 [Limisphaerales bacterium]
MSWHVIESQEDLETLDKSVCWGDSETVEYYGTSRNDSYFPSDVNRSGYLRKNIHVLCRICSQKAEYLEMVWIHCDWFGNHFLDHPFMSGHVDGLKRVEILDAKKLTVMRCARLIYRFVAEADVKEGFFYVHSKLEDEI